MARLASGGRYGFAQSVFQVGGNTGQAISPLLVALLVIPNGQLYIAWFALAAVIGILDPEPGRSLVPRPFGAAADRRRGGRDPVAGRSHWRIAAVAILLALTFSKTSTWPPSPPTTPSS